uniref:UPF0415 protein n=1 Tax=Trachysalambria curvirostris nimavirus TaxID=2984282 RepID=A0A9C7F770_9VIRU|nr:MAG: UPF0415 protein [Trachysalambria curvirostris nimavirus]
MDCEDRAGIGRLNECGIGCGHHHGFLHLMNHDYKPGGCDATWSRWVILRDPKATHMAFVMRGRKPLDEVAEDFLICAEQDLVFHSPPRVNSLSRLNLIVMPLSLEFWFCSGVSDSLANCLEDQDMEVKGERIPDDDLGLPDNSVPGTDTESEECSSDDLTDEDDDDHYNSRGLVNSCDTSPSHDQEPQREVNTVNLDVTAMIAYVSATSNGQANFLFRNVFLSKQADMERKDPVKKILDDNFEGRVVMACQEAVDHFLKIINTIGGDREKMRANELVSRLNVVPGQDVFKENVKLCRKVRLLARIIFGTGEAHKAVTITSNRHFIRAVRNQDNINDNIDNNKRFICQGYIQCRIMMNTLVWLRD